MTEPIFKCAKCGSDTDLAAPDPAKTVCPDCCEDHDYQHNTDAEWATCVHCNGIAPREFYDEQPGDY